MSPMRETQGETLIHVSEAKYSLLSLILVVIKV